MGRVHIFGGYVHQKLNKCIAGNDNLMRISIRNGLDVNWLVQDKIPVSLTDIYKALRNEGLLK